MSHTGFGASGDVDPDLPLTPEGLTYHVTCTAEHLADRIVLVGDPGRVKMVGTFLDKDSICYEASHREINVITGKYHGVPVTVMSTGMGTDNVEIVMNEVHILKEYDVEKRQWRTRVGETPKNADEKLFDPSKVKLIRVGTCGSPNDEVAVGCLAITQYAIGMDNTCQYYEAPAVNHTADVQEVLKKVQATTLGKVQVYATKAAPAITNGLVESCKILNSTLPAAEQQAYYVGTTCSGSGFYGCQGRSVGRFRGHLTVPHLTDELAGLRFNVSEGVQRVSNIEMENSALCYLSNFLGYQAGTVCVVIAGRSHAHHAFATPEQTAKALSNGLTIALETLTRN
ncbi:nucleoside phosphorylase-like protein [Leptomonas pyrrhocoris]|uniref:Nucleoside phosphorylase-like protein n=1 Tax=Leptomonas pyrrhocoris TaxID=157538 RepID=A0A0M9FU31_LEPPY|nr:nucleoside phosphorylase-like protein [Leptomonas pyrrhocoris]XP_015654482.1 nucleoside phosphorylase-like protein [Leptomonas pyrrhocoris]XP_015654483.1 nucleoside phosphorylase-like protein [Leptomonas pyrrhocoris]XP_015654484.1 nucleoside phosphorylase-like protein [Leptomonas pyrrhocoris]KPA76042.1 nucleoside phosphorylase-like protein [Leptomonas pyrrhocoris]KPA76043.1 nucleoside phosphorylase-like protein [Leptomonas pyrrhocoris]KPA76044.1 nucleoside phosphorylase-like protein [Lepto|eukprot:XP_015654481.1 nucleoside phosphorylase-like protein [Leptomonas pyrrhocoris]